jgi:hypothetical protein
MSDREEFEEWAANEKRIRNFTLHDDGEYLSERLADMWQAWQAARAQGACEWAEQLDACEFHGNDHEVCAEYSGQVPCARAQSGQGADAVKWSDPAVDPIVSKLYRKFKEWNRQGFGADDVTWCEVRGYVAELLNAQPHPAQQGSVPEGWRERLTDIYRRQLFECQDELNNLRSEYHNRTAELETEIEDLQEELQRVRRQADVPEGWRERLTEMVQAMHDYEMSVDEDAPYKHRAMMDRAHALLSTTPQADGWVLVPADHLPEVMEKAAVAAAREYTARTGGNCMKTIYKALVKAAPQPPQEGSGDE